MPTTQSNREADIENDARERPGQTPRKTGRESRKRQEERGNRHADEKFYLVMKQAAVVEEADCREQCGARENSDNCWSGTPSKREQYGENKSEIDRNAAEQRHGSDVDFARARMVHHSVTQGEAADGDGEQERCPESHDKSYQSGNKVIARVEILHGASAAIARRQRAVSIFSRTPRTSSLLVRREIPVHRLAQAFAERRLRLPAEQFFRELIIGDAIHGAGGHVAAAAEFRLCGRKIRAPFWRRQSRARAPSFPDSRRCRH